jgi:hypothetical protein
MAGPAKDGKMQIPDFDVHTGPKLRFTLGGIRPDTSKMIQVRRTC